MKGLWNGTITTDNHDAHAKYIISIEEHKDGIISGKALLYKPNLFAHVYGVQQFYGVIDKGLITINDIQILDVRTPSQNFHLCFKLSKLQYQKSEGLDILTGSWNSNTLNCLPGKIHLSRVIGEKDTAKIPPYVLNAIKGHGSEPLFNKTTLSNPLVLEVSNRVLHLELRDYLKEDDDTVSIYLNRQPYFRNLKIQKKPRKLILVLNRDLAVNEIIMYANNLGKIPPNTSNLVIYDGKATHKLLIQSSLQKSVAIYLKYKPDKMH